MVQKPVRRTYSERTPGATRDLDLPSRARFLQALGWLGAVGLLWGGVAGLALGGGVAGVLLGALVGFLVVGFGGASLVLLVADRAAGAARVLYNPSGSSTPRRKDYSHAKSLAIRGAHGEAIQAYQEFIARDPEEPEPYMAIARILRDDLGQPEEAAKWFRRVRRDADLTRGQEILVSKELVELCRSHLGDPRKAAPELARMAEKFQGTPDGEWAARELEELKTEMLYEERPE